MNEKRYRKLKAVGAKYRSVDILGDPATAELGIVCWGPSKGAVREAIDHILRVTGRYNEALRLYDPTIPDGPATRPTY